jgi:hypothetical protein
LFGLENEVERQRKHLARELANEDFLLLKLSERNKNINQRKKKYIKYILKNDKSQTYTDLSSYELRDIVIIYNKIKENKKNFLFKIFNFFINQ